MERKLKKRDIDNEYPKWSWVDYRFYDAKFFEEIKKLLAKRLDLEGKFIDVYVTITKVAHNFSNV